MNSNVSINILTKPHILTKSTREVGNSLGNYGPKETCSIIKSKKLATEGIGSCLALVLVGLTYNLVAHLATETSQISTTINNMKTKLLEFMNKDKNEQPKALIYGGWDSKHNDSFDLAISLGNLLEALGIKDFTMITSKSNYANRGNLAVLNNKIYIWDKDYEKLFGDKNAEDFTKDEIEEILNQEYEITELSEDIDVKVINETSSVTKKTTRGKSLSTLA